jgi:hypothetical protein
LEYSSNRPSGRGKATEARASYQTVSAYDLLVDLYIGFIHQ